MHSTYYWINAVYLAQFNFVIVWVVLGKLRIMSTFFLTLYKVSFFFWYVFLCSVHSIWYSGVKVKTSITMSRRCFSVAKMVYFRFESSFILFKLFLFELLLLKLFKLLPNFFFLIKLGYDVTAALITQQFLSLFFCNFLAFFWNLRERFHLS